MNDHEVVKIAEPTSTVQLELKHLFWATALIASGLGVGIGTIFFSVLVVGAWVVTFRFRAQLWKFLIVVLVLLILIGMMLPAVTRVREAARRTVCANNIRQIQLAILNFESAHGHFPTDTIRVNANGQEIRTSWRVHILPFIEMQTLHDSYRFGEPWNSTANLALQQQLATNWSVLVCPSHDTQGKTPYKLIGGVGTAFESGKKLAITDCQDGTSNTIAVVEDIANPVEIFEPNDLSVPEAVGLFNGVSKESCAHYDEDFFTKRYIGFNFGLLDGSVHTWPANPANKIDEGAFLISDGKMFDSTRHGSALVEIRWGKIVALLIYTVLCLYPLIWRRNKKSATSIPETATVGPS